MHAAQYLQGVGSETEDNQWSNFPVLFPSSVLPHLYRKSGKDGSTATI